MSSVYNCGYPLFVDGAYYPAALLRQFDGGVSVYDAGTAAAVLPAGGVLGTGSMAVTPGTGMTVTVAAGYCSVTNSAGLGAYRFGLMQQATLTVPANSTGHTRLDYVIANVQDLGSTGSFSQVEYLTGSTAAPAVPANSILLAEISVPNGASSILAGYIADERTQVVPPGGIIPIASLGTAPTVPSGTLMVTAAGQLVYSPYGVITEFLSGSGTWTAPPGILGGTVRAAVTAAGAGGTSPGSNGSGAGGGGGEWACEPALAVTGGNSYAYSCGTPGHGGTPYGQNATSGGSTTFAGDSVTVRAHGGQVVTGSQTGGAGGTGSTSTLHYPGGAGGNGDTGNNGYGGGGGAAGSPLGAGAAGGAATSRAPGAGGAGAGGAGSGGAGGYPGGHYPGNNSGPGAGGGGAGPAGSSGGAGLAGEITLSYILAPGPSAYPVAGSADYWYGYEPAAGNVAGISIGIQADGVSDYRITVQAEDVIAGFFTNPKLVILVDGRQVDSIDTFSPYGGFGGSDGYFNAGWTYYTSGAQGTTLPAGAHTVTFEGSGAQITTPAWIRVDQVLT